jgi:hypothetical protein
MWSLVPWRWVMRVVRARGTPGAGSLCLLRELVTGVLLDSTGGMALQQVAR